MTLGIKIDDEELLPRLAIQSVPYALVSQKAKVAEQVLCDGCITKDHLNFVAGADFAMPTCNNGNTLKANGSDWACNEMITVADNKIGINTGDKFLESYFGYHMEGEAQVGELDNSAVICDCGEDDVPLKLDCGDQFNSEADQGEACYESTGSAYQVYRRDAVLHPVRAVAVVDSKVGIGTGRPQAALHVRNDEGANKNEVWVADYAPEIFLEDLDGVDFKVAVDGNKLTVSSSDTDGASFNTAALAINGNQVQIDNLTVKNLTLDATGSDTTALTKKIWPVGAIYISTTNQNPSSFLGGTWAAFGQGRTLMGVGTSTDDNGESKTFSAASTGGTYNQGLTVAQLPAHSHGPGTLTGYYKGRDEDNGGDAVRGTETFVYSAHDRDATSGSVVINGGETGYTGSGTRHNNIQPFITVYFWKRTN